MTYQASGVSYTAMDTFKILAQKAGAKTEGNIGWSPMQAVSESRGSSVFLFELPDMYLAHNHEGLGTKNLATDAVFANTGMSHYDKVAQDTVAMIVNDMITVGALPISVEMHLAAGSSTWFNNATHCERLIEGWKHACDLARCVYSGGETPTLRDIVSPNTVKMNGSAFGIIYPKSHRITGENIKEGDAIVFLASSGIHANGLTMAREIADKLPHGYSTVLPNRQTYGQALLEPTYIYVPVIADCLASGIEIHYLENITGHGWRKLMRPPQPFTYVIECLPSIPHVLCFIQDQGNVDTREMYGNFNMGAGFAIYTPPDEVWRIQNIAHRHNIDAWPAGHIQKNGDNRAVIIKPLNITFTGEKLKVRS
jgi:phosphoribosylformylglycinamidine cyclo-ligase